MQNASLPFHVGQLNLNTSSSPQPEGYFNTESVPMVPDIMEITMGQEKNPQGLHV